MSDELDTLSGSKKLKLFVRSFILAQLHPLQLFSAFLFTILASVLSMHFENIGYEFPFQGWSSWVCWAVGYLIFNSLLFFWMVRNEIKYYQSRLTQVNKSHLYAPEVILGQILKANDAYIFTVAFWPIVIVILVLFSGPGGEALNILIWIPISYLTIGFIAFLLSLSKKRKLNEYFGLS